MRIEGMRPQNTAKETQNLQSEAREDKKLKDVCQQYEALFLNQLLSNMRKSIPKSDIMGDRKNEEMFQSVMDEEIAKNWSQTGSVGLANLLYQQMKKTT